VIVRDIRHLAVETEQHNATGKQTMGRVNERADWGHSRRPGYYFSPPEVRPELHIEAKFHHIP
jgi:hypothetical protein